MGGGKSVVERDERLINWIGVCTCVCRATMTRSRSRSLPLLDPTFNFIRNFTYDLGVNDLVPFGAAE